jgi:hypothetical protein
MPELKEKTEFKVGDVVWHPILCLGKVLAVTEDGIDVQFKNLETKRTIRKEFPLVVVFPSKDSEEKE